MRRYNTKIFLSEVFFVNNIFNFTIRGQQVEFAARTLIKVQCVHVDRPSYLENLTRLSSLKLQYGYFYTKISNILNCG